MIVSDQHHAGCVQASVKFVGAERAVVVEEGIAEIAKILAAPGGVT